MDFRAVPASDGRFVWVSGELDMWSADDFLAATASALRSGGPVVLDLTRLTFVDSDGIRAIVQVAKRLDRRGCLILHNPTDHVAKVLGIVGVTDITNIHLLDGHHADRAVGYGPGAWSVVAAVHHLGIDVDTRLARTRAVGRRNAALRLRTAELLAEARELRDRLARAS